MTSIPIILTTIASSAIAFFICGIPFGLIIANAHAKVDVRTVGSGNIGTTNVARSVGKGAGIATLACDAGKGAVATALGSLIISSLGAGGDAAVIQPSGALGWTLAVVYLAAICGHVFSPYLNFHGGKGIAVGFGGALGFMWPVAIGMLVVFLCLALPTRYVSLGSIGAAVALPLLALFIYRPGIGFIIPLLCVTVIVVWAHRSNIGKLSRGQESRFAFHHDEGKGSRRG